MPGETNNKERFAKFSGLWTKAEANEMMKIIDDSCGKADADFYKGHNPEFVKKILQGDKDLKAGKGRKITPEGLDDLCK